MLTDIIKEHNFLATLVVIVLAIIFVRIFSVYYQTAEDVIQDCNKVGLTKVDGNYYDCTAVLRKEAK